jgi:hypothetical protein
MRSSDWLTIFLGLIGATSGLLAFLENLFPPLPEAMGTRNLWACGFVVLFICAIVLGVFQVRQAAKERQTDTTQALEQQKQFDAFRDSMEKSNEGLRAEVYRQGHLLERVGQILGANPTPAQVKTAAVQLLAEAKVMLNLSATIAAPRTTFGAEAVIRDKTGKVVSRSSTVKP